MYSFSRLDQQSWVCAAFGEMMGYKDNCLIMSNVCYFIVTKMVRLPLNVDVFRTLWMIKILNFSLNFLKCYVKVISRLLSNWYLIVKRLLCIYWKIFKITSQNTPIFSRSLCLACWVHINQTTSLQLIVINVDHMFNECSMFVLLPLMKEKAYQVLVNVILKWITFNIVRININSNKA